MGVGVGFAQWRDKLQCPDVCVCVCACLLYTDNDFT